MADSMLIVKGHLSSQGQPHREQAQDLRQYGDLLRGICCGANKATSVEHHSDLVYATGTVTITGGSGSVGATINGGGNAVTWVTSDAATAILVAAQVNSSGNALVNQHVTASASGNVVTITAKYPGPAGNSILLAASGTGAVASGARLTGGASTLTTHTL